MRHCGLILLSALLSFPLFAQESRFSVDGVVTLSTAYVWRGDKVCGLHVNPDVCLHYGGLCLENYCYLAADGKYKEIDWDLSYTVGDFSFHVADYYARYSDTAFKENWFSWTKGSTNHVDEVAVVYDSSVIPFCAKWFTFFWGDWIPDAAGNPGAQSWSSYLELCGYLESETIGRGSLILGASVLKGSYTGYTKSFAPIHAELRYDKEFEAGKKLKIPIGASFVLNPFNGNCYAVASVGLAF